MMKHKHDVVEIWHNEHQLLVQVVHAQLLALLHLPTNSGWQLLPLLAS